MVVQDCADYNGEELKRRADLLNNLLVLIRRCRIKAALKTSRDNGFELRVRHTLRGNWGGGLELSRYQRCSQAHERHRIGPRHCHQRRLAESFPYITEIAEEILGQFVA